ncbi:hypothetical protein D3C81_1896400 [compost metagenome]
MSASFYQEKNDDGSSSSQCGTGRPGFFSRRHVAGARQNTGSNTYHRRAGAAGYGGRRCGGYGQAHTDRIGPGPDLASDAYSLWQEYDEGNEAGVGAGCGVTGKRYFLYRYGTAL